MKRNKLILLSKVRKFRLIQTSSHRYARLARISSEKGHYKASLFYLDRAGELLQESNRRLDDMQITTGLTEENYYILVNTQQHTSLALTALESTARELRELA